MSTIDARTLKRIVFSEISFSRPVRLDEIKAWYDGTVFSVTEYGVNGFLLSAKAKLVKRTMGDNLAHDTTFTMRLPAARMEMKTNTYWPFKEMFGGKLSSRIYTDVGTAIARKAIGEDCNDADYGFVLGDFRFNKKTGAPIFEVATTPWEVNFAMFYTKRELMRCTNIRRRDIIKIGDIWVAMVPFYLVASSISIEA